MRRTPRWIFSASSERSSTACLSTLRSLGTFWGGGKQRCKITKQLVRAEALTKLQFWLWGNSCVIEPPPPAPDNTTTAKAGRQTAGSQGVQAPRRTHSYILLTRSCVKQARGDGKQALEAREGKSLGTTSLPLILGVWRINISCSASNFFSQFTNTDRKRHRKFSEGSARIGQTPYHVSNVDGSTFCSHHSEGARPLLYT